MTRGGSELMSGSVTAQPLSSATRAQQAVVAVKYLDRTGGMGILLISQRRPRATG
jgi:hypothetical protein